jgi:hypothetical protein
MSALRVFMPLSSRKISSPRHVVEWSHSSIYLCIYIRVSERMSTSCSLCLSFALSAGALSWFLIGSYGEEGSTVCADIADFHPPPTSLNISLIRV